MKNLSEKEDQKLVEETIKKYSCEPDYKANRNSFIEFDFDQVTYKLVRLNDEQFSKLAKNRVPIEEDHGFFFELSSLKSIFNSFPKMYITLKYLFGESGEHFDDWKGSFSFPFLITFEKKNIRYDYLLNIFNKRASIEFWLAKVIRADNKEFDRWVIHESFEDFTRPEINKLIAHFTGYLNAKFNYKVKKDYDNFFFKTIDSEHILFGYNAGKFFEKQYQSEERFHKAVELMKEKMNSEQTKVSKTRK